MSVSAQMEILFQCALTPDCWFIAELLRKRQSPKIQTTVQAQEVIISGFTILSVAVTVMIAAEIVIDKARIDAANRPLAG